jgi:glycosyltransferase involved in cell wall biosynthesis
VDRKAIASPVPKLAIVTTHPIQYYAPLFKALANSGRLQIRVFYTWSQTCSGTHQDEGFGRELRWDIPLLDGYEHEFVPNIARRPGLESFWGLRNPTLIPAITDWNPGALLVYGWNFRTHLNTLRHFKGRVPILFRGDSTLLDHQPAWRAIFRRAVLKWVYSHVDVALSVGSNNRDYFLWCGMPDDRIIFAPHSVDIARFSREDAGFKETAFDWRRELQIGESEMTVVFAGKLQPKKNPRLLLDAFIESGIEGHLVYVGDGELRKELELDARMDPRIHFLPFQNQSLMPAVYRLGDLFVLPSRGPGETWGLALNEAMASGCAIAASTMVGATRDLIDDGVNGWRFESDMVGELVHVLHEAARMGPRGLRLMGEQARAAASKWSISESAARIEAAALELMSNLAAKGA